MVTEHLPDTLNLLYAELLDLATQLPTLPHRGITFPTKTVKGKRYRYMQLVAGSQRTQSYLGIDSEPLQQQIEQLKAQWASQEEENHNRAQLVEMLRRGGAAAPTTTEGRVLEVVEQSGIFLADGVLIGSHAFSCYSNMLGVQWQQRLMQTRDIDLLASDHLSIAVEDHETPLQELLVESGLGFFPVPALNRKVPSTSFKIRGRELRVDLLTPLRGKPSNKPVQISSINSPAQPLRYLEYLLEDLQQAVILFHEGVLVNVPTPARFALHKLAISQLRPAAQTIKQKKDLAQATLILEQLMVERPHDLSEAWAGTRNMPKKFVQLILQGAQQANERVAVTIRQLDDNSQE